MNDQRHSPGPIHRIFGRPMNEPVPHGFEQAVFGMGCYWGIERLFWNMDGVWMTEVGFAGGHVPSPTYEQVCRTDTGHAEVVRVVFDPSRVSYEKLLKAFWENHDPTQGNRQGNDVGSQYRSLIMTFSDTQRAQAEASKVDYDNRLGVAGFKHITTEIIPAGPFWPAEEPHQQYLDRNPNGYCAMRGTGVEASMPEPHEPA
ncbi:peptide-methionine (S)-S-oxide reductase MsrA [Paracoccus sp. S-4012]|uniref:peptide-methionine (S)-S-oxide reductase MsrA n=1 Tax=Paracoccus sp. S-4012 TaxID=2665648 RepID=UPI0012AF91E7|nr:peptide-methionine (S)-S-oxide reductase MsrA [Paracoccus sp. S-4012]MRX49093.1 peptide-methionine (S)-S-oxide reductase MsrA [Paracoccus sp. S-4012]